MFVCKTRKLAPNIEISTIKSPVHVLEQNKLEPLKGQICNTFKVFDSKMLEFYLKIFDTLKQ